MSDGVPLFELNPHLKRSQLTREFAAQRRIQVREVLTDATAREIQNVLARATPWAVAWQAGADGPHVIRREEMARRSPEQNVELGQKITASIGGQDYAFVYSSYPMLDAYLQKWNPGGPHDLLLEHVNSEPFLSLVRAITGMPGLIKADAQATLYAPNQFLGIHDDLGGTEGRQIAYVLNLSPDDWRPEWGGYLLFHDEDGDVVAGFKPRFNALNLFAVPQRHQVSYVPPFSPVGRYAITGWFRDR